MYPFKNRDLRAIIRPKNTIPESTFHFLTITLSSETNGLVRRVGNDSAHRRRAPASRVTSYLIGDVEPGRGGGVPGLSGRSSQDVRTNGAMSIRLTKQAERSLRRVTGHLPMAVS